MKKCVSFLYILCALIFLSSGCAVNQGYIITPEIAPLSSLIVIDGVNYIPLDELDKMYDMSYSVDEVLRAAHIKQGKLDIKILADSNITVINGKTKKFSPEIKFKNNNFYIPPSLADYIIKGAYKRVKEKWIDYKKPTIQKIVIDPGHGGKDPGASRYGIKEKQVVLDIAKRLRKELKKSGNFEIVMTRERDKFISLWKRSNIANKAKADLFISVHANASRSRRAKGFEVYFLSNATDDTARAMALAENEVIALENGNSASKYDHSKTPDYLNATVLEMQLNENREESKELATIICNTSSQDLCVKNRGVKSARFYVLKGTNMPSVLIEVGFISNRTEANNLNTSWYRQKVAKAISDGILEYKNKYEKTEAFTRWVN